MGFFPGINRLQTENYEIIVKHVGAKLSIQMLLIGQFFIGRQSETTWYCNIVINASVGAIAKVNGVFDFHQDKYSKSYVDSSI